MLLAGEVLWRSSETNSEEQSFKMMFKNKNNICPIITVWYQYMLRKKKIKDFIVL